MLTTERKELYDELLGEHGHLTIDRLDGLLPDGNILYAARFDKTAVQNHYLPIHYTLFRKAEESGLLVPGKSSIIDTSSSNSAISLAKVAHDTGFPIELIIPHELETDVMDYTTERILEQDGMIRFPSPAVMEEHKYVRACAEMLKQRIRETDDQSFILNHSQLFETVDALEEVYGPALDVAGIKNIDGYVSAVGNGLTMLGIGKVLQRRYGDVLQVAWEPFLSGLAKELIEERDPKAHAKTEQGWYFDHFGMEKGAVLHDIYGTGVPDIRFPFLLSSVLGGKVFGLRGNEAVMKMLRTGDRQPLMEAADDVKIYGPLIDDVLLVANEVMVGRYMSQGGDQIRLEEYLSRGGKNGRPLVHSYEAASEELGLEDLGIGRSSKASIAAVLELIGREKLKGKTFLVNFYDSKSKYAPLG